MSHGRTWAYPQISGVHWCPRDRVRDSGIHRVQQRHLQRALQRRQGSCFLVSSMILTRCPAGGWRVLLWAGMHNKGDWDHRSEETSTLCQYDKGDHGISQFSKLSSEFLFPESVREAMDSWSPLLERCQLPVSSQKFNPGCTRRNLQYFFKVWLWKNIFAERRLGKTAPLCLTLQQPQSNTVPANPKKSGLTSTDFSFDQRF